MQIVIWVAISALLLLAIRSLQLLRQLQRTDLKEGLVFEDPEHRLKMRYPPWWECREERGRHLFMSHEKDGVLELQLYPMSGQTLQQLTDAWAEQRQVAWDDPMLEEMEINGLLVGRIESPATVGESTREYLQLWIVIAEAWEARFFYRSSVVFGMVDSCYLHQMLLTIEACETLVQDCP
ncbi:MAG: hypothetical protein QF437_05095 [Planctomycetota bacterium]|jgi:hypothetical protein|nr:hypothetical protein [Planctomycetota bacterium]MDP7129840.1 hypothetical protein [Planctomycetota bacterium]MDP7251371.1 hypothetical protein [Planctomycetota bacterium]